jgi:hypothetical protein
MKGPPPKQIRRSPVSGVTQRLQLQQRVQQQSVCTREVIERIGAFTINEIYYYFVECLGADKRLIDNSLTRTRHVESVIVPRTDIDDKTK